MSRSDSTSQLTLHMFAKEIDAISAEFARTKANGDGGKRSEKRNIFDSPNHPMLSCGLALGVLASVWTPGGGPKNNDNKLFQSGSASDAYQATLKKVLASPELAPVLADEGIDKKDLAIHAIRKAQRLTRQRRARMETMPRR